MQVIACTHHTIIIMRGNYDVHLTNIKCDRIWENPPCSEFYEILVSCIFDKLYHRANLPPSFRPIARFA